MHILERGPDGEMVRTYKNEDIREKPDKRAQIKEAREKEITFKELFEAAEIFEEDPRAYNETWISARRFIDWENLNNLPTKEVKRRVIGFLNDWHCHLPAIDELAEKIKETYERTVSLLEALRDETLENFQFEKKKEVDGREYSNREILLKVFSSFCKIGHNFRGVAASKLLSLINPSLFVMWDTPICDTYGIRSPSEPYLRDKRYVPEFFPLMKQKANGVIDSYMKEKKCIRSDAIEAINSFRKWRPLAKLLDEYNWVTYSQE